MIFLWSICTHLGQVVTAPGGLGGQCVDWVNVYLHDVFGLSPIHANAVDFAHTPIPGWTWIANAPHNFPPMGAVVVWGPSHLAGTGLYGHVAVALMADVRYLLTLDQNWPQGSPVRLVAHTYDGVLGWWAPGHTV